MYYRSLLHCVALQAPTPSDEGKKSAPSAACRSRGEKDKLWGNLFIGRLKNSRVEFQPGAESGQQRDRITWRREASLEGAEVSQARVLALTLKVCLTKPVMLYKID